MKAKFKAVLDALFNSPYIDKADVATAAGATVVLFQLHLTGAQQAAAVTLIVIAYVIGHKIENALTK